MKKQIEKDLKKIITFRSISKSNEQIRLLNYLKKQHGGQIIEGNLIINKGNPKIAVVAHLDINQPSGDCKLNIIDGVWFSDNSIGCGFDDKTGIVFCLYMLRTKSDIQVIFTHDEEIGCIGAKKVILDENIKFLIQLDRRGNSDISEYTNGINVVTKSTKNHLKSTLKKYGFQWEKCIYTDIGEIAKNNKIQAVNISSGYYYEHTEKEYLDFNEFINSLNFASETFDNLLEFNIEPLKVQSYNYYSYYEYQDDFFNTSKQDEDLYYILESLTGNEIERLKQILKHY